MSEDPNWITGDLPREGQSSVPVRAFPDFVMHHSDALCEAIVAKIVKRENWDHLVLEAMVEIYREGETRAKASEAVTEIPRPAGDTIPNVPMVDTGYSKVEDHEVEIIFDLFDGVDPSDPPAGSSPIIPPSRRTK